MVKKVLITVGGTGGHVFPALSIASQLDSSSHNLEILFVGGKLHSNPYFQDPNFNFKSISCGSFVKKKPLDIFRSIKNIAQGIKESIQIISNYKPDLVVGFGSYHTLPLLLAAKIKSVPIILHEANSIPGKVNRLLSKYVKITGLNFPETAKLLKGKTQEVGLPLRANFKKGLFTKEIARDHFKLDSGTLTILIFGGSQGASALNKKVIESLKLLNNISFQVIHCTGGEQEDADAIHSSYKQSNIKAYVIPFEQRMDLAWEAADLVIGRAGASTIAELMEYEVPAILVPYPFATDNHQDKNADFLVNTVIGGAKLREEVLDTLTLNQYILSLVTNDKALLKKLQKNIRDYKIKKRPSDFCTLLLNSLFCGDI